MFKGKVQGVFFRDGARRKAEELGVFGWVRNLPDGSVEGIFEGEKADVAEVIRWCCTDQQRARVESSDVEWGKYAAEFTGFAVRG